MARHERLWLGCEKKSVFFEVFFLKFIFISLFNGFWVATFLFHLSACGVNRGAQFTGKEIPGAKEGDLSKEVGPPNTETPSTPLIAAVTPELAPNSLSAAPTKEPPPSSTPDSSGSNQPVKSKGLSSEDVLSVPPTSIAGSFLLECLVAQGNNDILYVSVMCRVLKDGIVQPSVGTLPTDWQISSTNLPITWSAISGINVPTIPGVWNSDFSLPVDNYIGRKVRVKNPINSDWIETTLKAIDSLSLNGFQSLASLGTISLGGNSNRTVNLCPSAVVNTRVQGAGVRTILTVHSKSGTVSVSLRGICGSTLSVGLVNPGKMIIKPMTSNVKIYEKSLANGSLSTGPLSLKEGVYEISFETLYNTRFPDNYDNIGFQSLQLIPIDGKLSSSKFEFFSR